MSFWARPGFGRKRVKRDRRQEWRSAAALLGASFEPGAKPTKDVIAKGHGSWSIEVSTYVVQVGNVPVTYTGARAYFLGRGELRVRVRPRNAWDRFLATLGLSGPHRLDRRLREKWVIRGKPRTRLPSLFADSGLASALLSVADVQVEVKRPSRKSRKRFGEGVGVVVCHRGSVVLEADVLAGMVRVVEEMLDALARVGEARRDPVKPLEEGR